MTKKRIIFMGTPEFAVRMLEVLKEENYEIVAVVTQPDKPVGRKQEVMPTPVKAKALTYGIPVLQPIKIGEITEELLSYQADLIVTCAYGQFIPDRILNLPTYGSINIHASLLPKYRGGAPIHKAIIDGNKTSGISIMRMVKRMDAGDVMAQTEVEISDTDTMGSYSEKLMVAAAQLLRTSLSSIFDHTASWTSQDESQVSFAYNISKEEEFISFHRDAKIVYDHIRGLIPWPVGYGILQNKKIKFHKASLLYGEMRGNIGEVLGMIENSLAVQAQNGILLLSELQLEGKGKVNASDFYNGVGKTLVHACFSETNES